MSRNLCFLKRMRFGVFLVTFLFVAPIHTFSSSSWVQLTPTGGPPPARFGHTSVYDPVSNRLIIFGGCSTSACVTTAPAVTLNDVWVLTNANGQRGTAAWIQRTPTCRAPAPRFQH